MKYCITGGAGFIGSNFLDYMVKKYPNSDFVCLDSLTYAGKMINLAPILEYQNFKFINVDITNEGEINTIFNRECFDIVINFAAETHVDNSINTPNIFVNTNVVGTQILLEASKKYKIKRYHQVSTDEVYGDLPIEDKSLLFTETTHLKPSSPYSASKASADLLTLAYYRTFKLPITISRCSNNYGPNQHEEKLIPLTIKRAINNLMIPVYGTGKNIRDWIHVKDHNIAIDMIVNDGNIGEVYNIGGNNELENLYVVRMILTQLKKPDTLITYVSDRLGHDLRYAIDTTKIYNELGWKPIYNFEDGLRDTINWYRRKI